MTHRNLTALAASALLTLAVAGCSKSKASTQDQQLTQAVQSKLNADSALQGDNITASVENGVATLTGTVNSNAAREEAAQDAQVTGVTEVNNQIGTNTAVMSPPAATAAAHDRGRGAHRQPSDASPAAAAAPAPPARVEISSGRVLAVRLTQALSSANAQAGENWQGQIATPVQVNGQIAIPQGAAVSGTIVAADAAGHFKGVSRLVLKLTALEFNGESYDLASREISRESSSRGKTTAERVGIGAAIGGVIGALAGHKKGAVIGAATGAGAGTAMQAMTKAPEVTLSPETVLHFTLSAPLKVVPAAGR